MARPEKPIERTPTGELYRGSLIRELRRQKGLTRAEMAGLVGCHPDSLSNVEANGGNPSDHLLAKIAEVLEVPLPELQQAPIHPRILSTKDALAGAQLQGARSLTSRRPATAQQLPSTHLPAVDHRLEALKADVQELKAEAAEVKAQGAVLLQIPEQLQALTAVISQLQVDLAALKQTMGIPSPVTQEVTEEKVAQPSGEQSLGRTPSGEADAEVREREPPGDIVQLLERAEKSGQVIEVVTPLMEERVVEGVYTWNMKKYTQWHEEIARVEEQKGELLVVMMGFHIVTSPHELREEPGAPILGQEGEEAAYKRYALDCRERRRVAFESQVKNHHFCHIMPIGDLPDYIKLGLFDPSYDNIKESCLCGGEWLRHQQEVEHLREILRLLKTYPDNYHIGLLTGNADPYERFFWEIKGRHTLLVEDHAAGQRGFIVKDRSLVGEVCRYFDWLWKSERMITDPPKVIELVENEVKAFDRAYAIS